MPPVVAQPRLDEQRERAWLDLLAALPLQVRHHGVGGGDDAPAGAPGPPAPLEFLGVEEELLVEQAHRLADGAAQHEAAPIDPVHVARAIERPVGRAVADHLLEQAVDVLRLAHLAHQRREAVAARLPRLVGVEHGRAADADARVGEQRRSHARHRVGADDRVGVEQQPHRRRGLAQRQVVGRGKPAVVGVPHQVHAGKRRGHVVGAAVLRRVVDHPHVERDAGRCQQGPEAIVEERARVVADDDHRHVRCRLGHAW